MSRKKNNNRVVCDTRRMTICEDFKYITVNIDGRKYTFHQPFESDIKAFKEAVDKRCEWGNFYSANVEKLREEFRELIDALDEYDVAEGSNPKAMRHILEELGDVFNVVIGLGDEYTKVGVCAVYLVECMTGAKKKPLMSSMTVAAGYKSLLCQAANLLDRACTFCRF